MFPFDIHIDTHQFHHTPVFAQAPAFQGTFGTNGSGDGQFDFPIDVAVDSAGDIYVADSGNDRVQKFDSSGNFLLKFGSLGSGDGQFDSPTGVAVDSAGDIYVSDRDNHRIQIFNSSGVFQSKFGSLGTGLGQFNSPRSIAVDSAGDIYVADTINNRIQKFGDNPLPVELSRFAADVTQQGITLNWRTESETNNVGFSIYRSTTKDGKFQKVGFVSGQGSTPIAHDYTFTDKKAKQGETYDYFIEDVDIAGNTERSEIISITFLPQFVSQSEIISITSLPQFVPQEVLPTQFMLFQNFPNPFNPETWIPYDLAAASDVTVTIFNTGGNEVRRLNLGQQKAGNYTEQSKAAHWDGRSDSGEKVASGVYFYHLQAGSYHAAKKMLILK